MTTLSVNLSDYNDMIQAISIIQPLLGSAAILPRDPTAPVGNNASASSATAVSGQPFQAPPLQLEVLRHLYAHPTGTMTSYEIAAALGMSQPDYAKKIRGTGRAPDQAQDYLYTRGWAYPNGPQNRVRCYTITQAGRRIAAQLSPL